MKIPSRRLRLSDTCYGAGEPVSSDVRVDGHPIGGSDCQASAEPDPGPSGMLFTATDRNLREWGINPGDTVHITITLRRSGHPGGGRSRIRARSSGWGSTTLEAADTVRFLSAAMSRVTGGTVQIYVDGRPRTQFDAAGSTAGGEERITPGRPHTIRLVHHGGESPRGLLGLVVRRPVG